MPQYIEQTRHSPFLESMLIPAIGPRPIPDDIMKEHTSKAETTTYNITTPASGSGLFVFYNNNNTGLIGTHYTWDGTNYVYDNVTGPLTTAQALYENYNFGRLISQIITLKSSTLPAGVYALNGTLNCINVYNTLSEVSSGLNYNNLLSLNNNITDKVGNVLVGDGLALLSLPQTFDKPYCRFNDPTPFTAGDNMITLQRPTMVDDEASMVNVSEYRMNNPIPSNTRFTITTINIDSTTPMEISGSLMLTHSAEIQQVSLLADFVDAFGAVIATHDVLTDIFPLSTGFITRRSFTFTYTGSYYTNGTQPVAAVRLTLNQSGPAAELIIGVRIRPFGASNAGTNQPITLVAYQGVAAGSQLTISGITNYELIPNSNLKKNLKTEYGHYDPTELEYVKRILMNKDKFGIRTVQALPDYNRNKELYRDLYLLDSDMVAKSFSWNGLLKTIKDIVLKGAASVFPVATPFINVVDELATNLTDKYVRSAGGAPIIPMVGRASGGTPIAARARGRNNVKLFARAADTESLIKLHDEGMINSREFDSMRKAMENPEGVTDISIDDEITNNSVGERIMDVAGLATCGVPFPVILSEGSRNVGNMLYICIKGDFSSYLPRGMRDHYSTSINGYKIHGLMGDEVPFNMLSDVTLLPVTRITGDKISIPTSGFPVVESSCWGAINCVQIADWLGVKGAAVIGATTRASYPSYQQPVVQEIRNSILLPNAASPIKLRYLSSIRMEVVESGINASYTIGAVVRLLKGVGTADIESPARALDTVSSLSMAVLDALDAVARGADNPLRNTDPFLDYPLPPLPRRPPPVPPFEEEEEELPLPPPPEEVTAQDVTQLMTALDLNSVKEIWDEAGTEISKSDPVFSDGMAILNWFYSTRMVTSFADYIRTDPTGIRFKRMMSNFMEVPGVQRSAAGGLTSAQAQRAKAERISDSLLPQYPMITADWVSANGYRGPSTEQARFFKFKRQLPEPGYSPEEAIGDKVVTIYNNVMRGFLNATNEQKEQLMELIEKVNRGPNPEELRAIFGAGRSDLELTVNNIVKNNRLNEDQAALVRNKVMQVQRGLTGQELADIRGVPVRIRTKVEQLEPAAPIFNRPGTSGRLQRLLANPSELV